MSSLNFSATASKDTSLSKSGTVGPSISWASSIGRLKIKVAVIQHTQLSDSDFSAFLCILRSNYSCIDLSKLHTRSTRIGPNNGLIASPAFVPKELQSSDSTKVSYLSTDHPFSSQLGTKSTIFIDYVHFDTLPDDIESEMGLIHASYRVFAAIGVASPTHDENNHHDAYIKELDKRAKSLEIPLLRCILLGIKHSLRSDNHSDDPNVDCIPFMAMALGEERATVYMRLVINELVTGIFTLFDSIYSEMINQPKILLTPRSMEETHWTASQAKKKSGARRLKIIGDMYLLTASYEEAIKHLQLALDETRGGSDPIWNVAAQENFHFATALKHENQVIEASLKLANTKIGSNPSIPSLLSRPGSLNSINSSHSLANSSQVSVTWLGLPEKLNQISFIYSKCGLSILAFETHRLIANIFDHAGVPVESTMALCIGWSYSRKMGLKDQLYALSCITDHFSTLGMRRKCAFFFGRLSASLENGDASAGIRGEPYPALAVLKKVFSSYSIDTGNRLDSLQWPRLQIALLDCALTLVCDARASKSLIGEYAFALLSCIGGGDSDFESGKPSNLNETEQIRLANLLRIAQHRGATPTSPLNTALPLLIGLIVISEKKCWKKVHKNQYHFEGAVELDDPFIFRPSNSVSNSSTRFENENLIFAVGEFITIDVFLQNPFAFPIELVALKLCPSLAGSESADNFELDNVNILLPAWCQNIKVSITFRSQISGTVNVSKVSAIVFGIPIVLRCQSVAKSFKTIEIIVIPEQPPVKLADIESLCTIDMKKSISLFNGEASEFSLIFTNLSQNIPVSLLGIRGVHEIDRLACQQGFISAEGVTNSDENDEPLKLSKYQFTESNEVFQGSKISENLVIPPLSQVVFGFDLIGIIGWKKTCIIFEYCGGIGDGSQVYVRTVEYYIESTVKPSIFARSIWIHPNVNELNDCMPKMFPDGIDTKLTTKPLHDLIREISLKDNYNGGNKLALLILDLVNSSDYTTFRVELEIDGVGASCMSYENNSVIPGATGRFLSIITRQSREKSDRLLQNILDNRLQTVDQNLKTARQKLESFSIDDFELKDDILRRVRAKWHCDPKRYGTVDFSAVQIKGQSASAFYTHKQSLSLQVIVEPLNLDAQEGDHEFLESLRHSGQQQSSKESSEKDIHPISGKHRIRLVSHLNALIGDKYFIEFKIAVRMDDEYCLITCLDNEYFVTDGAMRCVVDQKTGGGSSVVIYPTRAVRLSAVVSAVPYGTQLVENAFDEKLFSPIVSINVK